MSMPMLAGVGLLCCVSSSVAAVVYNKGDEEDPVVPKTGAGPSAGPSTESKDIPEETPSTESKDIPEETPSDPYADWRFVKGIDYKGKLLFTHTMHDVPPASKEVCLNKCKESDRCKFVTFTQTENMCWGYETKGEAVHHGNRNNYFKP